MLVREIHRKRQVDGYVTDFETWQKYWSNKLQDLLIGRSSTWRL